MNELNRNLKPMRQLNQLMDKFIANAVGALRTKREGGATAVEYALIVALVAIIIIIAVSFLGNSLSSIFSRVASTISIQATRTA